MQCDLHTNNIASENLGERACISGGISSNGRAGGSLPDKNMASYERGRKPMKAEIRARSGSLALTYGLDLYYMHVRNLLNGNTPLSDLLYPEVLCSSPQKK